jgi:uncharacterized glyoxalase superfamily protein PhnB
MAEPDQKFFAIAPYFVVDDVTKSAEFYRDMLGFDFDKIWGEPPQFVIVHRDELHIMLKSNSGQSHPNRSVDKNAVWDAYIWITDADALCEEFRSRGVKITRKIEDMDYGCRDFDVEDDSGYILCFGQNLETR